MKIVKNPSKIYQKSMKMRYMGAAWGDFGGTWAHVGWKWWVLAPFWSDFHFLAPRWLKMHSRWDPGPFWAPSWSSKWSTIGPKRDPKRYPLDDRFEGWFLKRFGANLVPSWAPKTSQNGTKLGAKSIQVWCWFGNCFWKDFGIIFSSILYTT